MKCTVCRGPAVIDLRRHNANFCADHFLRFCREQVVRAIDEHAMIEPGDRVLVAVSGGKDSLALWDLLLELGYDTEGMTIGLGIGDYSVASTEAAVAFAERHDLTLHRVDLRGDYDYDVPTAAALTSRVPCSSCGLSKRHLIDKAALDGDYDVVATGHNLDDEAAVLFGNVLHWHTEYLGRQRPTLTERVGAGPHGRRAFPRKVKPLVRLAERETAAYCVLRGIDYIVEECPMAEGNRHLRYKEALNAVEAASPGAKQAFYFGFLARAAARFAPEAEGADGELRACARCGSPTTAEVCAFCRLVDQVAGHDRVPVELVRPRRGGRRPRTRARP
ncbi:MAG: tRNA(Ile)-lysidine synthetase [Acidimicrobiales bacterium]